MGEYDRDSLGLLFKGKGCWRAVRDNNIGLEPDNLYGVIVGYAYFGEPVYVYSLKQGINDGFLTPFKVRQIATTLDDYVYTSDDQLVEGEVEEGKRYKEPEFNRTIEIVEREKYRVKLFMSEIDQRENLLSLKYHTVSDAAALLGGVPMIRDTFVGFQRYLYE